MGLDVGDRRIGLAVSIPPGTLILPAGHLERTTLRVDAARILQAAIERDAMAIIVGMPYNTRGQAGEQARKTTSLIRALERLTEIPIITVDERYTSSAAAADLIDSGRSPSRERGAVDAGAAAAILRRFLDSA